MSIRLGTSDIAKYPFLREASEYVRQTGFGFEEFDRPEMQYIVDRAARRIEQEIVTGQVFDEFDERTEILTFLISLMIVKSLGMEPILRKYSLFESMRAEKFLVRDLEQLKSKNEKRQLLLFKIFEELFKVKVEIDTTDSRLFKVRVVDYLLRASHFHEQEWKLVNRLVHGGYVYLDADETVRLIRVELSALIYDRVKEMSIPSVPDAIKSRTENLKEKLRPYFEYRTYKVSDYPPCVKHAIEVMNRGENLPHSARVMLATYMLAIEKPVDEIVALFQNAPDYNERITRYQVQHLAGEKGSRTRYSVPSCDKLRNENLCFATAECSGIINPVQFGRRARNNDNAGR
jgi:DNA primase large subunit